MRLSDIKPCPFCGEEARIIAHVYYDLPNEYGIRCKRCKAEIHQFFLSEYDAIKAWNRRAGESE